MVLDAEDCDVCSDSSVRLGCSFTLASLTEVELVCLPFPVSMVSKVEVFGGSDANCTRLGQFTVIGFIRMRSKWFPIDDEA